MPDKEIPRQSPPVSPTNQVHAAGATSAVPHTASDVPRATTAGITPPPHTQVPLACRRCGVLDVPVVTAGAGQHAYLATCAHCSAYIQWLSQYAPEERERRRQQAAMQRLAPTEPQLAYLHALGDSGPPPANRAEASRRIDHLITQRKEA